MVWNASELLHQLKADHGSLPIDTVFLKFQLLIVAFPFSFFLAFLSFQAMSQPYKDPVVILTFFRMTLHHFSDFF